MANKTMYVLSRDDNAMLGVFTSWRNAYLGMLNFYVGIGMVMKNVGTSFVADEFVWLCPETGDSFTVYIEEVDVNPYLPPNPYDV